MTYEYAVRVQFCSRFGLCAAAWSFSIIAKFWSSCGVADISPSRPFAAMACATNPDTGLSSSIPHMCCSISFEAATMLAGFISWRMASWSFCVPHGAWLLSSACFRMLYFFFYRPARSAQPIVNWFRRALRVRHCCALSQSLHLCNGVRISYFCLFCNFI